MDLSYATILVFGGEHRRLYREAQLAYIISDEEKPANHPVFSLDTNLGFSILQLTDALETSLEIIKNYATLSEEPPLTNYVWKMFFDGASSKEGVGVGVLFVSPTQETIYFSYKLEFETTNNVAEYEALILGLRDAKDMGIKKLSVFGDAELIVHQTKNIFQTKHPRLRSYRNELWDLVGNFFSQHAISFIPREENFVADSLAVSSSNFRIPILPKLKYDVEFKYRPSISNNVKYVDVFLNIIANHRIVKLPSIHIPKGLVPLEKLFDENDVVVKGKVSTGNAGITKCNLGIEKDPKYVKLSRKLSREKRVEYVKLLKDFDDVFAWTYEDL
jgi:ribonuclease HI